jgi:hypothetical protein
MLPCAPTYYIQKESVKEVKNKQQLYVLPLSSFGTLQLSFSNISVTSIGENDIHEHSSNSPLFDSTGTKLTSPHDRTGSNCVQLKLVMSIKIMKV